MFSKLLILTLSGFLVIVPGQVLSQDLKSKPKRAIAPIRVTISDFNNQEKQFRVNCRTTIKWYGIPQSYGTVWLRACRSDKSNCGGDFPISNSGSYYKFRPDDSMTGHDWVIKVATQDEKYAGFSNSFFVDGMLPGCCSDGVALPPCK